MVIPIRDDNPTRVKPVLTIAIIAACIYIFAAVQPKRAGEEVEFLARHAAIPCEVVHAEPISNNLSRQCDGQLEIPGRPGSEEAFPDKNVFLAVIVSMFLHGSWLHVLGNMLFLWVFGNNVEDRMGRFTFLAFYIFCGYVATYGFAFGDPNSRATLVGASGAIAGVLGAYLVLFPRARVTSLIPLGIIFFPLKLPAWLVLGGWFLLQWLYSSGGAVADGAGVAYLAHVFGFLAGLLVALAARPALTRETAVTSVP
jgi:membrane associated rhomboid family serine protease